MSVHDDMKGWQKGLWMLIIGAFLVTELRAIQKDRIEVQKEAVLDRSAQDSAFAAVQKTQNENFSATASDLTAAIGGIKSTLATANTTLRQTQPHAALHPEEIEFYPSVPREIEADTPYGWNYHFINSGTATATDLSAMQKIYIANADDRNAQLALVARFNREWMADKKKMAVIVVPNVPHFNSLTRTFSNDEMQDFEKKTVYFVSRFEYSDGTGRWRMDDCEALQRNGKMIDATVFHPCQVFINARYPVEAWRSNR